VICRRRPITWNGPVDCSCEGEQMLCIQPGECADYGACEPACPPEATFCEDDVPEQRARFTGENARLFDQLGSPGSAARTGKLPCGTGEVSTGSGIVTRPVTARGAEPGNR
jgi:hypothetical protein